MKKGSILIVLFLVISLICLQIFSTSAIPIIKDISNKELKQFCQLVVNHTTSNYESLDDELFTVERDDNNKVSMVNFNMSKIAHITGELVLQVEELLLEIEEGVYVPKDDSIYSRRLKKVSDDKGVVTKIPLGLLTNNPFFSSMGPNLKIRYQTISHVSSSIHKEVKSYGINRMMISVNIEITIRLMVVVPFYKEEHVQHITFPLLLEIIEGEVPSWYQN